MAWYVKVFCLLNGVLTEVEHASPAQQEVIESSDQAIVTVCATATGQMEVSRVKSRVKHSVEHSAYYKHTYMNMIHIITSLIVSNILLLCT